MDSDDCMYTYLEPDTVALVRTGLASLHERLLWPTRQQFWHVFFRRAFDWSLPPAGITTSTLGVTTVQTLEALPMFGEANGSEALGLVMGIPTALVVAVDALCPADVSIEFDTRGHIGCAWCRCPGVDTRRGKHCAWCASTWLDKPLWGIDCGWWGRGTGPKCGIIGASGDPTFTTLTRGCWRPISAMKYTQMYSLNSPLKCIGELEPLVAHRYTPWRLNSSTEVPPLAWRCGYVGNTRYAMQMKQHCRWTIFGMGWTDPCEWLFSHPYIPSQMWIQGRVDDLGWEGSFIGAA